MTEHCIKRLKDRLAEIGYFGEAPDRLRVLAYDLASKSKHQSEAIRLFKIKNIHGIPWSDDSNGDEIWAIIRGGRLITIMFRRSTQPMTAESLRVEKVTILPNIKLKD